MPKKILVVDDNRDLREMMAMFVEMQGYEVLVAASGREAIDMAEHHCPDLIRMDVCMPDMDGLEATKIIKATEHCKDTPIIAVTAFPGMRANALAAGCVESLQKPLELLHLQTVMENCFAV